MCGSNSASLTKVYVAVRNLSNHGFDKFRCIKKFFKTGTAQSEDAAVGSVKSKRPLRSRPRSARSAQSVDHPLVVSPSLLGTKSFNGTPCNGVTLTASRRPNISRKFLFVRSSELIVRSPLDISIKNFDAGALFPEPNIWSKVGTSAPEVQCPLGLEDGPKSCWECLRRVYRTKNEARLLLLKDKLADLRMQGPVAGESFLVVQDIFQQLVVIGQAAKSRLDVPEGTIDSLSEGIDAVVQSVYSQKELHSLKQLANQLAEMRFSRKQAMRENKLWNEKRFVARIHVSHSIRKSGHDSNAHVHYRIPPCNFYWCWLRGRGRRDCEDLEEDGLANHVRQHKNHTSGLTQKDFDHSQFGTETN